MSTEQLWLTSDKKMIAKKTTVNDFPSLQMVRTARIVRSVGRITLWSLIFAICGMIFLPWRQTARGTGMVVALDPQQRVQPMLSPIKGIVKSVREDLREGSRVKEGEVLIEMRPFAEDGQQILEAQIAAIKLKIEAAESGLAIADQNAVRQADQGKADEKAAIQEVESAKQKVVQAERELASVEFELAGVRNEYEVALKVSEDGLISGQELISKRAKYEQMVEKRKKQQAYVTGAEADLVIKRELLLSKIQQIEIKNQDALDKSNKARATLESYRKEKLDAENKQSEFENLFIRAPKSGFIQQWSGLEASQSVKEGTPLFVIVPDADELAVEMKVSGNDMPLLEEGAPVRLQFEGWPAVQFVGWPSVAIGTFGGKVNRVFPTDDGKGFFRVIVTVDNHFEREDGWPDDRYLRQGVRANGWVLLERVPLGYEIWRQLNGFPPVVADEEPTKEKGGKVKLPKA
ncbi:MAG: HlyD family efflux transporter periplasmic adaptor subunit [Planctomycetota bacterium]